ncbi:MAG: AAA family ATPase [Candidatus Heimdallarchaeota archaeon]|nr:AAA family ATPase [Candidatus Heimdallarchaeota archaeon]
MDKGRIIMLNGASSSGKSTIANSLQEIMDEPYLTIGLDKFFQLYNDAFPKRFNPPPIPRDISLDEGYTLRDNCSIRNRSSSTFHHFLAAFSLAGNNVIADTVIDTEIVLKQCINILGEFPIVFVGVHCSLEELERREQERGNRKQGLAKRHYDRVHARTIYDIEVDTSNSSPKECAQKIKEDILANHEGYSSKALKQLRKKIVSTNN